MSTVTIERRRTLWDVVFGILLFIGGLIVLGDVVIATAVSVLLVGWLTLVAGIVGILASLFKIGKGGAFWSTLLSGALMLALGILILRNPLVSLVAITMAAGLLFLTGGIIRFVAGFEPSRARWVLLFSGALSIALGLIVIFHLGTASLTLLGILLGVQLLVDGATLVLYGRAHVSVTESAAA